MCVVIVDDEQDVRELVAHVLEDEGYQVLSFAHPLPVTSLKDTDERPHLFLVDIMMPQMNGISLAARLTNEGFEQTPKIAMSAYPYMMKLAQDAILFDAGFN